MYIGLYLKYTLFLFDFNETNFINRFSKNIKKINFQENPSSGDRVVLCGQADRHTRRS